MGKSGSFCETYQVTRWFHSDTLKSCSHVQTLVKPVTARFNTPNPPNDVYEYAVIQNCTLKDNSVVKHIFTVIIINGNTKWPYALQTRKYAETEQKQWAQEKICGAAVRNRTNKQITSQTHLGMQLAFFHMIIHFCIIESQAFASMIYLKIKCTVA